MEIVTKLAWLALAATHAMPSLPLFRPQLVTKLYGVPAEGTLGLLLSHRAALFAIAFGLSVWALFDADVRRVASVIVGVSMASFLILYVRAGVPQGGLRTIAIIDAAGLIPLAWVAFAAWVVRG
jgi:hypothetical protein